MSENPNPSQSIPQSQPSPRFVSLRWRFLLPLFIVLLITAMVAAYAIVSNLGGGVAESQNNILIQSSNAVNERSADLFSRQRTEAQRIAFTIGVPEAIRTNQVNSLHAILEGAAVSAGLDSVIVTDATGIEVLGLQRVETPDVTDYAVNAGTNLSQQPIVRAVLDEGLIDTSGLVRTAEGLLLYTAAPIQFEGQLVGIVLVGQRLDRVLASLQGSAVADVAVYDADGVLLETTLTLNPAVDSPLLLDRAVVNQVLASQQPVMLGGTIPINGVAHNALYTPFVYGPNIVGIVATLMPDNVPYVTGVPRQVTALAVASIAGAVVIMAFIGITRVTMQLQQVTDVAQQLTAGMASARTGMSGDDEVSAVGKALDDYAESVQERQDKLRTMLRRQRREANYLQAVLESLPDGVIVQDTDGRVVLMNDHARQLLGSQKNFRASGMHALTAVVTDVLGQAIAPGIYTLGDPQRIDMGDKMLSAQAAAIMATVSNQRLGTVIVVRDITEMVQREQARERLLDTLAQDIERPLAGLSQAGARSPNQLINAFAREISQHAANLQRMIVDMRELTAISAQSIKRGQRPLHLETLVWAIFNDWRQIAQAANLTMHVMIEHKGLYVLGDERRLRWAIGNVIDNAIKYNPPGGALTIEIKDERDGLVYLRVRDNGVGIAEDDFQNLFVRFYRGTPISKEGQVIRVPGMGQGLTFAREIIQAHGGTIDVKTKPGIGTAVYFSLPITSEVSMALPQLEEQDMEGETVILPEEFSVESYWSEIDRN